MLLQAPNEAFVATLDAFGHPQGSLPALLSLFIPSWVLFAALGGVFLAPCGPNLLAFDMVSLPTLGYIQSWFRAEINSAVMIVYLSFAHSFYLSFQGISEEVRAARPLGSL